MHTKRQRSAANFGWLCKGRAQQVQPPSVIRLPTVQPQLRSPALDPVFVHRRYRDMQLIVDVVMSGGVPQRRGGPPAGSSHAVQLYFSNPDLLWANEFPRPRFGQGAFAHAVMVRVALGPSGQGWGGGKGGEEGRSGGEERSVTRGGEGHQGKVELRALLLFWKLLSLASHVRKKQKRPSARIVHNRQLPQTFPHIFTLASHLSYILPDRACALMSLRRRLSRCP